MRRGEHSRALRVVLRWCLLSASLGERAQGREGAQVPKHKDLKRLVRDRMTRTGENYISAHAAVVGETRRHEAASPVPMDEGAWLADLQSGDSLRQVRALHAACPCSGSSLLYEQYMPLLHELKKDPRPEVRRVAIHLDEDALEVAVVADERANGFVRNRPGGWGRRREPRRKAVRYGDREMPADRRGRARKTSDVSDV